MHKQLSALMRRSSGGASSAIFNVCWRHLSLCLVQQMSGPLSKSVFHFSGCLILAATAAVGLIGCDDASRNGFDLRSPRAKEFHLLLSEAKSGAGPKFELENVGRVDGTLTLRGKNCSCYDVIVDGQPIKVGDQVVVKAGDVATITLDEDARAGNASYRLLFEPAFNGVNGELLELTCAENCYTDFFVRPQALVCEFNEADKYIDKDFEIVVTSRNPETEPPAIKTPAGIRIIELAKGERREIAPAIFRQFFTAKCRMGSSCIQSGSDSHSLDLIVDRRDTSANSRVETSGLVVSVICNRKYGFDRPSLIDFGQVNVGASASKRYILRSLSTVPFSVSDWQISVPEVTLTVNGREPNMSQTIVVQCRPTTAGDIRGVLEIHTDAQQDSTIRIPLSAKAIAVSASSEEK